MSDTTLNPADSGFLLVNKPEQRRASEQHQIGRAHV